MGTLSGILCCTPLPPWSHGQGYNLALTRWPKTSQWTWSSGPHYLQSLSPGIQLQLQTLVQLISGTPHNLFRPPFSQTAMVALRQLPSRTPYSFTGEFYQAFQEKLIPILPKPFQNTEGEEMLPSSFYEAKITLIPKPDRDTTKK